MAIQNYIKKKEVQDNAFITVENENYIPGTQFVSPFDNKFDEEVDHSDNYWMALRDAIGVDIEQSQ